ncbi:hypothetical protein C922_04528 [Plasmodium inui San Antonio 1]|uniref:Uncharacterized protein n=1 Tax=Plasmodium inui San Antonio 1 TaxID=1237626 RepID=W7A1C7_9APIC|nr:hypothetical protein C922_04528 [Plasmodium inui San Antonio 1]EUD65128.1 hypothetical protein C922_04528 [Plasmodium inui San Antonio 1]
MTGVLILRLHSSLDRETRHKSKPQRRTNTRKAGGTQPARGITEEFEGGSEKEKRVKGVDYRANIRTKPSEGDLKKHPPVREGGLGSSWSSKGANQGSTRAQAQGARREVDKIRSSTPPNVSEGRRGMPRELLWEREDSPPGTPPGRWPPQSRAEGRKVEPTKSQDKDHRIMQQIVLQGKGLRRGTIREGGGKETVKESPLTEFREWSYRIDEFRRGKGKKGRRTRQQTGRRGLRMGLDAGEEDRTANTREVRREKGDGSTQGGKGTLRNKTEEELDISLGGSDRSPQLYNRGPNEPVGKDNRARSPKPKDGRTTGNEY